MSVDTDDGEVVLYRLAGANAPCWAGDPRGLRDQLHALVERYAATLDDAEIGRLMGGDRNRELAGIVAIGEELLQLAAQRSGDSGWLLATQRLNALGG